MRVADRQRLVTLTGEMAVPSERMIQAAARYRVFKVRQESVYLYKLVTCLGDVGYHSAHVVQWICL